MGGGKGGSTSYSERPLTSNELTLIDSQASNNNLLTSIANEANMRSAQQNQIWLDNYLPVELNTSDPNTGLAGATVAANDSNQLATNAFLSGSKSNSNNNIIGSALLNNIYANRVSQVSDQYGEDSVNSVRDTSNQIQEYSTAYDGFMGGINDSMGTADQGVLGRLRAQNLSGLSTANEGASRGLMAQLAQRGLTNSGVGAKAIGDLSNNYQQQLAGAQANAYGQAINQSDAMRNNQVSLNNQRLQSMIGASQASGAAYGGALDKQYQARLGSLSTGYNAYGNALQNMYNTNVSQQGSALNAISSENQQRTASLTNYAQLGRGMAGMSSNYLGQAGQMYGSAAQNNSGMFGQLAGANQNYNNSISQQNQANSAAKGASTAGLGKLAGAGAGFMMGGPAGAAIGATAMSDSRLKDNITKIGTVGDLNLYTWVWNEEAQRIEANHASAIGVIAQEVQELYPDAVVEQANGYLAVDYNKVIAYAKGSK